MENIEKTKRGASVKLAVSLSVDGRTMDEMQFRCKFYTVGAPQKSLTLTKDDMIREDASHYRAVVDTMRLGCGTLRMEAWALVPDGDMPDGLRTEYAELSTNVYIKA